MGAIPAWPPDTLPRLFVETRLGEGPLILDGAAANYLGAVLRMTAGDRVRLFDDVTGEWLAEVATVERKRLTLAVTHHLAAREAVPDLWLLFAPLKKGRIDWLVEKACELGVARLLPVLTQRTVVERLNLDRLRAHAIEAAEQCGRSALPMLDPPAKLAALLAGWSAERQLLFADETGGVALAEAARRGPAAILIGPEGGFTPEERAAVRAVPQARGIALGPRILRADTAAAAAVSLWMAHAGEWALQPRAGTADDPGGGDRG